MKSVTNHKISMLLKYRYIDLDLYDFKQLSSNYFFVAKVASLWTFKNI